MSVQVNVQPSFNPPQSYQLRILSELPGMWKHCTLKVISRLSSQFQDFQNITNNATTALDGRIGGRICVRAGRQSTREGANLAAPQQRTRSIAVIQLWLEGTLDKAASWGACLKESANETIRINTFHAGLITPRDLTDLERPFFDHHLFGTFPISILDPVDWFSREVENSWVILFRTAQLNPTALLQILVNSIVSNSFAILDIAAMDIPGTPRRTTWLIWCALRSAAVDLEEATRSNRPLWRSLGGGGLHCTIGYSSREVANARRKQCIGRPLQNPYPCRMAGGFLKRQGDMSGDMKDATSQASVTVEVAIVSLWSESPVPMFVDPANPTVLCGHIIPPQAENTPWRAVIDLSLLRPWHGTGRHMCALNVVALALLPGCSGATATLPSALNAAVMQHFSETTSKPRIDARAAAINAVMSCGTNYSNPTKEARLSLPTIYECLPANATVLAPVAIAGPTDDLQFQVVGRGTVTMTEMIAQIATTPCIV
jgi:hypothetical protein